MSHPLFTKPTTPALTAFFKGNPIEPIGFVGGRAVYPIAGGSTGPSEPERPEDVSEDEWNALGDPGKQALVRVRGERDAAVSAKTEAERQLAASRARPAPPKPPEAKPTIPAPGDQPDFAALIKEAVDAAVKPLRDAEEQRTAQAAADKVRTIVLDAAKSRLHDATDALQIDLAAVLDDNGAADPTKVTKALDDLIAAKPHLAKSDARVAPLGIGGGAPAGATTKDQVASILASMQGATGIRSPKN